MTITNLPLWIVALIPTNSIITERQRMRFWCLILLPVAALCLLLGLTTVHHKGFMSTAYSNSIFYLLSPASFCRFFACEVDFRPSFNHALVAALYSTSLYGLTISVATILRPPRPFDANDENNQRRRAELTAAYLFHIYAVPLVFYTILQLAAMAVVAAAALNAMNLARSAHEPGLYSLYDFLLDSGTFVYILFIIILVVSYNLFALSDRVTAATGYLQDIANNNEMPRLNAAAWARAAQWDISRRAFEQNNRSRTIRWADDVGGSIVSGAQNWSDSSLGIATIRHEQKKRFCELAEVERRRIRCGNVVAIELGQARTDDSGDEGDDSDSSDSNSSDDSCTTANPGPSDEENVDSTDAEEDSASSDESADTAIYDPLEENEVAVDDEAATSNVADACVADWMTKGFL